MQFAVVKALTAQLSFVGSCQLMHVNIVFPVIITNKLHGYFEFYVFFFFFLFALISGNHEQWSLLVLIQQSYNLENLQLDLRQQRTGLSF